MISMCPKLAVPRIFVHEAACVAGGRVGGIFSPLIFEQIVITFGGN